MSGFELTYNEQAQALTLCLEAGAQIDHAGVVEAMRTAGYGDLFVHEDVLVRVLGKPSERALSLIIAERRGAEFSAEIGEQSMTASLTVSAPFGGRYGSLDAAMTALKAKNIVTGIEQSAIVQLLAAAEVDKCGQKRSAVVAQGKAPCDGEDARFEAKAVTPNERILCPRTSTDGHVDYHDLGDIPSVHAGDVLMRKIPATPGELGRNVLGQTLVPKAGKDLAFEVGIGSIIAPHDPNLLISEASGVPVMTPRGMRVEDVYRIDNVDIGSGYVVFDGNVMIKSDVARNMKVTCEGSISVGGFVECAFLQAQKDIMVGKGVSGGATAQAGERRAKVHAIGALWTPFAQCAELRSGGLLVVEKLAMHCSLHSDDAIRIGGEAGGASKCIGGDIDAVNSIKCDFLGAPNEGKTLVRLKGQFAQLQQALKNCNQEILGKQVVLRDLEKVLDKQRSKVIVAAQSELEKRIVATVQSAEMELKAMQRLHDQLEAQLLEQYEVTRVIVTRAAYIGVEISIADRTLKLVKETGPGSFVYSEQGVVFRAGDIKLPKRKIYAGPAA